MKKIITFLVAGIIYGLFMYLILFVVENDFSTRNKIFQSIFFGVGMGFFEMLVRPAIIKKFKK